MPALPPGPRARAARASWPPEPCASAPPERAATGAARSLRLSELAIGALRARPPGRTRPSELAAEAVRVRAARASRRRGRTLAPPERAGRRGSARPFAPPAGRTRPRRPNELAAGAVRVRAARASRRRGRALAPPERASRRGPARSPAGARAARWGGLARAARRRGALARLRHRGSTTPTREEKIRFRKKRRK
ncbi:unnamed protein product [Urochloa humidicola]